MDLKFPKFSVSLKTFLYYRIIRYTIIFQEYYHGEIVKKETISSIWESSLSVIYTYRSAPYMDPHIDWKSEDGTHFFSKWIF